MTSAARINGRRRGRPDVIRRRLTRNIAISQQNTPEYVILATPRCWLVSVADRPPIVFCGLRIRWLDVRFCIVSYSNCFDLSINCVTVSTLSGFVISHSVKFRSMLANAIVSINEVILRTLDRLVLRRVYRLWKPSSCRYATSHQTAGRISLAIVRGLAQWIYWRFLRNRNSIHVAVTITC